MEAYTLPQCGILFSDKAEFPVKFEVALPEHLPSAARVVRADPELIELQGTLIPGGVQLTGKANVKLLYLSDRQGALHTTTLPVVLEHTFDASKMPAPKGESHVEVRGACLAATARLKGARAFEVRVQTCIQACVTDQLETPLLDPEQLSDVELHDGHATAVRQRSLVYAPEPLSETIELEAGFPAVADVLSHTCKLRLTQLKSENGQLSYSGNLELRCTYRAEETEDTEEPQYVYLAKELPLEGVIEEEALSVRQTVLAHLEVGQSVLETAFDPYGESRLLELTVPYTLKAKLFEEQPVRYFDDGYSTTFACSLEKKSYLYEGMTGSLQQRDRLEHTLSAEHGVPVELTDAGIRMGTLALEMSEATLVLTGKAGVWVLGKDEKGEPVCVENILPVHIPLNSVSALGVEERVVCETVPVLCEAVIRDGTLIVRTELETTGIVLSRRSFQACAQIQVHYDEPRPVCRAEYIVYYPDAGESLWAIAKKYEVSQESVRQLNGFSGDELPGKRILVIPCV